MTPPAQEDALSRGGESSLPAIDWLHGTCQELISANKGLVSLDLVGCYLDHHLGPLAAPPWCCARIKAAVVDKGFVFD